MLYDFYYSKKREAAIKKAYIIAGKNYHDTYINGKKYTEMVEHGKQPVVKADDNVLVCSNNDATNVKIILAEIN